MITLFQNHIRHRSVLPISDGRPINVWFTHSSRQFMTCSLRYAAKAPGVHITDPSILCAERTNSKLNTKFTLSILGISSFWLFSTRTLPATPPHFY